MNLCEGGHLVWRTEDGALRPRPLQNRGRGRQRHARGGATPPRPVKRDGPGQATRVPARGVPVRPWPARHVTDGGRPAAHGLCRPAARPRGGSGGGPRRRVASRAAPSRRHGEHRGGAPATSAVGTPREASGARGPPDGRDFGRPHPAGARGRAERGLRERRHHGSNTRRRSRLRRGARARHAFLDAPVAGRSRSPREDPRRLRSRMYVSRLHRGVAGRAEPPAPENLRGRLVSRHARMRRGRSRLRAGAEVHPRDVERSSFGQHPPAEGSSLAPDDVADLATRGSLARGRGPA